MIGSDALGNDIVLPRHLNGVLSNQKETTPANHNIWFRYDSARSSNVLNVPAQAIEEVLFNPFPNNSKRAIPTVVCSFGEMVHLVRSWTDSSWERDIFVHALAGVTDTSFTAVDDSFKLNF